MSSKTIFAAITHTYITRICSTTLYTHYVRMYNIVWYTCICITILCYMLHTLHVMHSRMLCNVSINNRPYNGDYRIHGAARYTTMPLAAREGT